MKKLLILLGAAALLLACGPQKKLTVSGLNPKDFKGTYNGMPTALYTMTNANGMEVCVTNFGGRIVSIMVPDKDGKMQDVVLSFDIAQSEGIRIISDEVNARYPDYNAYIVPDIDVTD
jgi:aldose 1-epimerase